TASLVGFALSGLELRLDQSHNPATRSDQLGHDRQYLLDRDERTVDRHEINRRKVARKQRPTQAARVDAFQDSDPAILPQFPREFPAANIPRVTSNGATLEEAVGEPACGRANIYRYCPGHVESEVVKGVIQLVAAATDVLLPLG